MRFLLALPVVTLSTLIELSRLHHKCDECLDERPVPLRLEHEGDHCVRSELGTHCLTEGLPCHTPFCANEECVLCIIHREIAVATHLFVSLIKAPHVRVKTAMAWERLRQIKADFPVLSVQPGGELRDQARAISFGSVQVSSLRSWKVSCLSSANKSIGGMFARTNTALVETVLYAETTLNATDLCAKNSLLWIAWFCRSLAQTGVA